jgi:hypothetical protein
MDFFYFFWLSFRLIVAEERLGFGVFWCPTCLGFGYAFGCSIFLDFGLDFGFCNFGLFGCYENMGNFFYFVGEFGMKNF